MSWWFMTMTIAVSMTTIFLIMSWYLRVSSFLSTFHQRGWLGWSGGCFIMSMTMSMSMIMVWSTVTVSVYTVMSMRIIMTVIVSMSRFDVCWQRTNKASNRSDQIRSDDEICKLHQWKHFRIKHVQTFVWCFMVAGRGMVMIMLAVRVSRVEGT